MHFSRKESHFIQFDHFRRKSEISDFEVKLVSASGFYHQSGIFCCFLADHYRLTWLNTENWNWMHFRGKKSHLMYLEHYRRSSEMSKWNIVVVF